MKTKVDKTLSAEDMVKKSGELREELFNLRIQNLSGSLEDNSKIRQTRRSIARMLTLAKLSKTKN